MTVKSILADFDTSFTTSFKHTAKYKYGIEFSRSNVDEILICLQSLKRCIDSKQFNKDVHVGYDFGVLDVNHILNLLSQIINAYDNKFSIDNPPQKKLYTIINLLRNSEEKPSSEIAKDLIFEMVNQNSDQKKSKESKKEEEIARLTLARALERQMKSKKNKK